MNKKIRWRTLLIISIVSTLVLIVGFFTSIAITFSNKKTVEQKPIKVAAPQLDTNYYNILVLGDSLAKGTGDETGNGFGNYFADGWKSKTTKEIKVYNLAVNGDVSSGLLRIVQSPEAQDYIKKSEIVFISIGGNEINKFKNTDIALNVNIKDVEDRYLRDLKTILSVIRAKNKTCMIVFLGLYNPYGTQVTLDKTDFLISWNYDTEQLIGKDSKSIFIPTYDLFKYNLSKYLTIDNFHPNSIGYKAIANRMLEALTNYK